MTDQDKQFEQLLEQADLLIKQREAERAAQAGIEPEDYYSGAPAEDICSVAEFRYRAQAKAAQRSALWLS